MDTEPEIEADRPFPWWCGECAKTEVYPKPQTVTLEVKRDGVLYSVTIKDLMVPTCAHCGTEWFDCHVDDEITKATDEVVAQKAMEAKP